MSGTIWIKLFHSLIFLIFLLQIVERCDGRHGHHNDGYGGVVVSLRLGQFLNPISRLYGENCCNFRNGQCGPCYYEFQICVSRLSSYPYTSTGDQFCDYGRWHSGLIRPGTEPFYLPSRFPSGHSNPLKINMDDWKGRVRVTIRVKDVGEWGYNDDQVVEYTLVVKEFRPARMEVDANWYYWFLVRYGARLGVQYSVYCQRDYYGDLCQVHCRPPNFFDRYTCDPNTGRMICQRGYTGYYCRSRILPTSWRPFTQKRLTTTVASTSTSAETVSSSKVNVETPTTDTPIPTSTTTTSGSSTPTSITNTPSSTTNNPSSTTNKPSSTTNMPTSNSSTPTSTTYTYISTISTPTSISSVSTSSLDTTTSNSITNKLASTADTPISTMNTPTSTMNTPTSTSIIQTSETRESLARTVQHVSTTETHSQAENKSSTPSTTSTQDTQTFTTETFSLKFKTSKLATDTPTSKTHKLSTETHMHTPVTTILSAETNTPTSTEEMSSTPQTTTSTTDTHTSKMNASSFTSETPSFKIDTATLTTHTSMATSIHKLTPTTTMPTEEHSQTPSSTAETSLISNTPIIIPDTPTSEIHTASTATHVHTSTVAILTSETETPVSTEDPQQTPSFNKETPSVKSKTPNFITGTPVFETNNPSTVTHVNTPTTATPPSDTDTIIIGTSTIRTDITNPTVYTPTSATESLSRHDKLATTARSIDQTVSPKSSTTTTMQPTDLTPTDSVSSTFEPSTLITEYVTAKLHSQDANGTTERTTYSTDSTPQHTQYSSETTSLKTLAALVDRYVTTDSVTSETLELSPSRQYSETTNKSSHYPSSSSSVEGVTIGSDSTTDTYSVVTDVEYMTDLTHVPEKTPAKDTTVEVATTDIRYVTKSLSTPRSKTKLTKKPTDRRRLKNDTSSGIPTTTAINPTSVESVTTSVAKNASVSSTSSAKQTYDYTNVTDTAIQTTTINYLDMTTVNKTLSSITDQGLSKNTIYTTSTISTNGMVSTESFPHNSTESTSVRTNVTSPNVTITAPGSSVVSPTVANPTTVRLPPNLQRNHTYFPVRTMSSRLCWTQKSNDVETSCKCGTSDLPILPSIDNYSWATALSNGKTDNFSVEILGIS